MVEFPLIAQSSVITILFLYDQLCVNYLGFWYMHCHTEFHEAEGMALFIQEGNYSEMNGKPAGMRTCGNFYWSREDFQNAIDNPVSAGRLGHCFYGC